jgi:hypothetical protein
MLLLLLLLPLLLLLLLLPLLLLRGGQALGPSAWTSAHYGRYLSILRAE